MTRLKVLETSILHASDQIIWLDGSSGETEAHMLRVAEPLALQLTTRPRDLQVVHGSGRTAFLRRPGTPVINGVASEADKQPLATPSFAIAGMVSDPAGRYLPRQFRIDAGQGKGHGLVVYPSPLGTHFGPAGGLVGRLCFQGSGAPVPWALLTLVVTTAVGATLTFRGQASEEGDFTLALHRLPPLPEGIASYSAELGLKALAAANGQTPPDPADLVPMALGALDQAETFASPIALTVVPGTIRLLRSANRDHIAVQPQ